MGRGGNWFGIVARCFVAITCVTSLAYLSGCSWAIAEVVNKRKNFDNDTSNYHTVELSCLGVSIFGSLLQCISSLALVFHCGGNLGRHAKRWIVAQIFLLVVVILAYIVPFSFDENGGHADVAQFWDKATSHVGGVVKDDRSVTVWHLVNYAYFADVASVVVGVIAVVIGGKCCGGFGESYQAVS